MEKLRSCVVRKKYEKGIAHYNCLFHGFFTDGHSETGYKTYAIIELGKGSCYKEYDISLIVFTDREGD